MKTVKLLVSQEVNSREIIEAVVSSANNGATIEEIRKRLRILDALAAATGDEFRLEDADWELLKNLYTHFKFIRAHKDIVAIYDDIVNAGAEQGVMHHPG